MGNTPSSHHNDKADSLHTHKYTRHPSIRTINSQPHSSKQQTEPHSFISHSHNNSHNNMEDLTMNQSQPENREQQQPSVQSNQFAAETSKDVSMVDLQKQASESTYDSRTPSDQFIEHSSSTESSSDDPTATSSSSLLPLRRKSTLILTDDMDYEKSKTYHTEHKDDEMIIDSEQDISQEPEYTPQDTNPPTSEQQQQQQPPQQTQSSPPQQPQQTNLIPTVFKWVEGGSKVFVMGTFTGWRKMIALNGPSKKDGSFSVQIALPPGTHRFKFVVDNEVRFSNFIPTATDTSGHFVNYLEIIPSEHDDFTSLNQTAPSSKSKVSLRTLDSKLGLTKDDDDMGNGYSRYHDDEEALKDQPIDYITSIPPIFTDPKVMEEYYVTLDNNQRQGNHNQQWLIPPQLPPHLESVILNSYNHSDKDNTSGALSIPNHVVLNHLATTSIKHNTLAVASVIRYKRKYVTQVLYAPLQ